MRTVYTVETDTRRARIKARKTSAFRGNIIYHARDGSRTDWRLFNLSLMGVYAIRCALAFGTGKQ